MDVNQTDEEECTLETPMKRFTPNDKPPVDKFHLPITMLRLIPRNSKVLKQYLALTNDLPKPNIDTCVVVVVYLPSSEISLAVEGSVSTTLKRKVVEVPPTTITKTKTVVSKFSGMKFMIL
ncbi:unnamed protein product [Lactuca saligna]|uniref:Uncharacterized protein n=1 Tax=Lactuca saligna TaxID=75948 RepID=A0AA35ZN04_LACSI|nr:unnamed protein product [Lactuca saligna]